HLSGCLPSAHRAVLHAIERALLRPRVACRRALGAGAVPRSAATGTAVPTMVDVELLRPWMLLFLPLALLPLLRSRQEALGYSYVAWIPRDSLGRAVEIAAVACAVVAIAATVVGLAGPGRPESRVMRTGRGAEILVLMDRSRSMDERMMPSDWQATDPLARAQQAWHRGPQKSHTARELLSRFVAARAEDRF